MKEVDHMNPHDLPCLLTFEGCSNAKWLVRLPINPLKPVLEILINHPWHEQPVALKYAGQSKARPEVHLYTQVNPEPIYPKYQGGGLGMLS